MIQILIFSKNRAFQLDGCLQSLFRHIRGLTGISVNVLYTTDSTHEHSYNHLIEEWKYRVSFMKEYNFYEQVITTIVKSDYILFVVDDTLFLRPFDVLNASKWLERYPEWIGFSYRLGQNTIYQYPIQQFQQLPEDWTAIDENKEVGVFCWKGKDGDFAYPLEVSSSMYRSKDIIQWIGVARFNNPNELEILLSTIAKLNGNLPKRLAAYRKSRAVSVPWNRIQQTCLQNRYEDDNEIVQPLQLLKLYEKGYRLEVSKYDHTETSGCHQALELFTINITQPLLDFATSISFEDKSFHAFSDICNLASNNDDILNTFKRHPAINVVLEHVNEEQGKEYMKVIRELNPLDFSIWERLRKNDSIGEPRCILIENMTISPTTLRYTCIALHVLKHLQEKKASKNIHIIEIGAGYGGQPFIFHQLCEKIEFNISHYHIFDLESVVKLQKRYLKKLLSEEQFSKIHFNTLDFLEREKDVSTVFFSAYAFAELDKEVQEAYCDLLENRIDCGYMIWNTSSQFPQNFKNICSLFESKEEKEENPRTGPLNKIISW